MPQPTTNDNSSGDLSRHSSFGGGLTMRGAAKQPRIASASASNIAKAAAVFESSEGGSESDGAEQRRQQQQGHGRNRNGIRNSNGRTLPSKPPLQRSKSDFARPVEDSTETQHNSGELSHWGARHGFEDHYQSEEVINQLANVCFYFSSAPLILMSSPRTYVCPPH